MYSYLMCTIFWSVFTLVLCILGIRVCKKKTFSEGLVSGYILYSVSVAAGGIVVQVFNLPWFLFAGFMVILWTIIILLILKKCSEENIKLGKKVL